MAHIGNRAHATFIHNWYHDLNRSNMTYEERKSARVLLRKAPDGWLRLGNGSYRVVYLHIDTNVVYKVEVRLADGEGYDSATEVRHAQRLRRGSDNGRIASHLRIPVTSGFRIGEYMVVAMEAVRGAMLDGYSGKHVKGRVQLLELGKFEDMHCYNYIVERGGVVVPIDMASPRVRDAVMNADSRVLSGTGAGRKLQDKRQDYWKIKYGS